MPALLDLLALLLAALGLIALAISFAAWAGARRNQDPGLPPEPLAFGWHGLNREGRDYAKVFWKALWFAVLMFALGLLAASFGTPDP